MELQKLFNVGAKRWHDDNLPRATQVLDRYRVIRRGRCRKTNFDVLFPLTFWRIPLSKKLYVGNLGYNVSKNDLEQMFASYGTVNSAQVITDRDSGSSKGFGFVEMGSDKEAQAAIAGLNGKSVDGRSLTVNEARPQEPRSGGGGGGGYGGRGGKRF